MRLQSLLYMSIKSLVITLQSQSELSKERLAFSIAYFFLITIIITPRVAQSLAVSMIPSLKGKQIKDYFIGETVALFEPGSELARAVKAGKLHLCIYGIHTSLVDTNDFVTYNEEIVKNEGGIYPAYYELVRSQNFIYMVFEEIGPLRVDPQHAQQFAAQLKNIYEKVGYKLKKEHVFMRMNGSAELRIVMPYSRNLQKVSNLYTKFHNKSILAELFVQHVRVADAAKCVSVFLQNLDKNDLFQKLLPFVAISSTKSSSKEHWQPPQITKSTANKLLHDVSKQYPEIDESEFEELMAYVHINPNLKKQAADAYLRQSAKVKANEADNEITEIVNNVNSSIFNMTKFKTKDGKSKAAIQLNKKKLEATEFQVHFQALYSTFSLFKRVIKSYLDRYRNGYAGIIAAYLITLIGILRRLRLYNDLSCGCDVFEIGGHVKNMNFQPFLNIIRKDLAKQARNLVNLRAIIQNASMPYKTYEALLPYLEEDLEGIDLEQTQQFCFYYMTILLRMRNQQQPHQLLCLELMEVLVNSVYALVYCQEDTPSTWNNQYYEMKKVLIGAQAPQWFI